MPFLSRCKIIGLRSFLLSRSRHSISPLFCKERYSRTRIRCYCHFRFLVMFTLSGSWWHTWVCSPFFRIRIRIRIKIIIIIFFQFCGVRLIDYLSSARRLSQIWPQIKKLEKIRIPPMCWWVARSYNCLNMANLVLFFSKIMATKVLFFPKKILIFVAFALPLIFVPKSQIWPPKKQTFDGWLLYYQWSFCSLNLKKT